MTNETKPLPLNAEALNAVVDALGALTMCIARRMPAADRAAMAEDLARIAAMNEAAGRPAAALLIADISRAAK